MGKVKVLICICIFVASLAVATNLEADEKECADQLGNLAACIPFVSGTAKKPTPECCQDTQKVKAKKPKCLCVLIKESTDPSMGLPVNTTLALQMPSACNIDANVSDCPTILNLPPDSPDANIFQPAGSSSTTTSSSTTDSPQSTSPPTGSSSSSTTTSSPDSSSKSDSKEAASSNAGAMVKLFGGDQRTMASAAVVLMIIMFI